MSTYSIRTVGSLASASRFMIDVFLFTILCFNFRWIYLSYISSVYAKFTTYISRDADVWRVYFEWNCNILIWRKILNCTFWPNFVGVLPCGSVIHVCQTDLNLGVHLANTTRRNPVSFCQIDLNLGVHLANTTRRNPVSFCQIDLNLGVRLANTTRRNPVSFTINLASYTFVESLDFPPKPILVTFVRSFVSLQKSARCLLNGGTCEPGHDE